MSQIFPCNEWSGLVSGVWESMVPGLRHQLLVKKLHINFWEKKQQDTLNKSRNSKHKKIKYYLFGSYSDEAPHHLWDTLWNIMQKHPRISIIWQMMSQTWVRHWHMMLPSSQTLHHTTWTWALCNHGKPWPTKEKKRLMPKRELTVPWKHNAYCTVCNLLR